MVETRRCPNCGAEIPPDAAEGVCPKCLIRLGLEDGDSSAVDANRTAPVSPVGPESKTHSPGEAGQDSDESGAVPDLAAGARIRYFGDYELLDEIARGGMGVVYKARQVSLNRIVAVKMILSGQLASEEDVKRFHTEAQAAANLQHPNIVAIHEVGECKGQHYFSMEYVDGTSLTELIRGGTLPARKAAEYVLTIGEAIQYAHDEGTLHRDLKPSNILIDASGRPRITDFGLARRIEGDSRLTASGAVLGTPSYMPPEQAAAKRGQIGPASDVYSLGAMLYEFLIGRPPFRAETPLDTLVQVLQNEPVSPRVLNPKVSRDLETVCMKCLEKDPLKRYASAKELAEDLGRFLKSEPIKARPVNLPTRAWRWCRRNPWPTAAAMVLALLVLVTSISFFAQRARLWRSLLDQARAELPSDGRWQALDAIRQAARIKKTPELQQEAFQAITTPGLLLIHEFAFGHTKVVVFSPDGTLMAAGGARVTPSGGRFRAHFSPGIKVWELSSGKLLNQVASNTKTGAMVFCPNAPYMALQKGDNEVLFWDPRTGKELAKFEGRGPLLFSPDGSHLTTRTKHDQLVWNVATSVPKAMHKRGKPIAFLSNEELLLQDGDQVLCWNFQDGSESVCTPKGTSLFATTTGSYFVVVSRDHGGPEDQRRAVWDLRSREETGSVPGIAVPPGRKPSGLSVSQDGRLVAFQDPFDASSIRVWDAVANRIRGTMASQTQMALPISFGPQGSMLVNKVGDDFLKIWDVGTRRQVASLKGDVAAFWSKNGDLLATVGEGSFELSEGAVSSANMRIRVWEVAYSSASFNLPTAVRSLCFSPDGRRIAANAAVFHIGSVRNRTVLRPSGVKTRGQLAMFSSSGALLCADSQKKDQPIRVWKLSPEETEVILPEPGPVDLEPLLALSPDGTKAVFSRKVEDSRLEYLELWDLVHRRKLGLWNQGGGSFLFRNIVYSPDGKLVATLSLNGLRVWQAASGKRLVYSVRNSLQPGFSSASCMTFSPDGKVLFSARGGEIHRYEMKYQSTDSKWSVRWTGKELESWKGVQGEVSSIASGFKGDYLATGGEEGTICLWKVRSQELIARWRVSESAITALGFSPEGDLLASGSAHGLLNVWNLPAIRREMSSLGLGW